MKRCAEVLPGYYEIPGFSKYAISPEGHVIDRETRDEIPMCQLSGYMHYKLKDAFGRSKVRGRARLMMLTFRYPGDVSGFLQVNHIDGNKNRDRLDNLEWVTPRENCEHAGATGLSSKCFPISVRDVDTGKVVRFPSIIACAREFGVTKDAIAYRVNNGEHRIYPERKQYRKGHHDVAWIVYDNPDGSSLQYGTSKRVLLRSVLTGEVHEFDTQSEAAKHLNVSPAAITMWLQKPNQPVLPGYVQLKWAYDFSPWRQVNDAYLELADFTGNRPIKVTNVDTGEVRVFQSGVECAKKCGLLTTTLYYRLTRTGKIICPDRCLYEYYTSPTVDSPTKQ